MMKRVTKLASALLVVGIVIAVALVLLLRVTTPAGYNQNPLAGLVLKKTDLPPSLAASIQKEYSGGLFNPDLDRLCTSKSSPLVVPTLALQEYTGGYEYFFVVGEPPSAENTGAPGYVFLTSKVFLFSSAAGAEAYYDFNMAETTGDNVPHSTVGDESFAVESVTSEGGYVLVGFREQRAFGLVYVWMGVGSQGTYGLNHDTVIALARVVDDRTSLYLAH